MSLWRHLTRGLFRLTRADAAEREIADEVEHFFDEAARAFEAQGLSPDEARRAMAIQLGTTASVRERVRSHGWEHTVETVFADLRYGARRLLGNPGFTTVTVLTLALGIGASVAMFSAAKPTLIDALPYPEPDRIVTVWDHASDGSLLEVTFGTYRELDERSRSLDRAAVFGSWSPSFTGRGEAERVDGQRVSADYFDVLGVRPAVGRDFEPTDDRPGGLKVVILSDALWHRRFGGDPSIVGSQIQLDDEPYTVIGVMPRGFENVLAPSADAWRPLQYDASLPSFEGREWGHHLRLVARLGGGIDLDAARRELEDIAGGPIAEFSRPPWAMVGQGFVVTSLNEDVMRSMKPALLAVLGAVVILLLVASVNVTNLLLGRSRQRRSELAMRLALGASRPRLVRQLLTETVLLALPGGGLGVVVAAAATPVLIALVPAEMPRHDGIGLDGTVLTFALGLTFTVALAAGLLPALEATRGAHDGLQRLRPVTGRPTTRRVLVVVEVALAAVLLVSAGLLLRSLNNLFAVSLGFDRARVLTMQVQTSGRRLDRDATHRFFAQALDAVRQVPGVTAAAFTSQLPFGGEISEYGVTLESSSDTAPGGNPAFRYAVSPGYLETLRIPLIHGRLLDRRDTANAPPVVVISNRWRRRSRPAIRLVIGCMLARSIANRTRLSAWWAM